MTTTATALYIETNGGNIEHIPMNERLKNLRLERNFTMQEMADHLGVKRSTYAGYEAHKSAQNHRYPKMELLIKIAEKLDTSSDFLLCLTNDKRPKSLPREFNKLLSVDNLEFEGVVLDKETKDFIRMVLKRTLKQGD